MRKLTEYDIEMTKIREQVRILQWLVDNNIVRPAMDQRDGWVALNCYTGQPLSFDRLAETAPDQAN